MFVAVRPPEAAVEHLEAFLADRREHAAFRWTPAEQLHLTLAFAADVPDHDVEPLLDGLEAAAGRRTPFEARLAGGGSFPDAARARVLWAGLDLGAAAAARTELDRLAAGARTAVARAGLAVDGQRFRPHVTVARLGRPEDVTRWVRVLDTYDGPAFTVDHVELVASHLGEGPRRRPRHEVLAEVPLGGAPRE
ncbi:RNA 2',3'-cyclic phosphodiesterase [Nocardioides litoris]|uniref:RNA 2',3'-cyclic phosphodiesterase n=1 Tax=Nocardioides litoris TaxID=1926648 RepID=UPI001FE8D65F|nr:RNA 2',3'-cyclic phosphodiesterase [Nocardioides litoris]